MNLSKDFDLIIQNLLLARLRGSLNLICNNLKSRRQRVVGSNKMSLSKTVITGVPQGSIDGRLTFNLFINDHILFLFTRILSNYADDNNLCYQKG